MLHRLDAFVLKWLPKSVTEPLKKTVSSVVSVGNKGLQATAGRITDTVVGRCAVLRFALKSTLSAPQGSGFPQSCAQRYGC